MAGRAANDEVDMGEIKNVVIDDYSKGKASSTRGGTTLRPIAPTSASVGPVVHVLLGLITVVVLVCLGLGAAIYVEVKDNNGGADCDGLANQVSALQDKVSQTEASCTAAFTSEVYTFEVHKQKFPSCLRPPGYPNHAWTDILAEAEGSTVNFYSWDGSNQTNSWIDYWLKPRVADYFNINLVRVGIDDTAKAVDIVRTEVNQNNAAGSVGLIWINGDNFAVMKNENLLYGPWADRAPNSVSFDFLSPAIALDKGIATDGLEMPYNLAQSVFITTLSQAERPKTIPELVDWVKGSGQGKFTYSQDFTGQLLVRFFFHEYAGGPEVFTSPYDNNGPMAALYAQRAPLVWAKLNEIAPFLHTSADGTKYPDEHPQVEDLFANGDIQLDVSYGTSDAATKIEAGLYPPTTKGYVLDSGTISNTNFVAIPINAASKPGCMVVGNYIAQLESMFSRAQPERWGSLQSLNPKAPHIANTGWLEAFDYVETQSHSSTPTVEELAAGRLGELHVSYVIKIEEDWKANVLNAP